MRAASSFAVIAAACAWLVAAGSAQAQRPRTSAAATAQFDKGRALMKAKQYAQACAAFERSQALDAQWGTLYNLAGCYARSGKLASAWAAYRELAQRDTNPSRRKDARIKARALIERLPKLVIQAPDPPPGFTVTLDGTDVTAMVGADSPIDLGEHRLHASAPAHHDFDTIVSVDAERQVFSVAIELAPQAVPVRAQPAPSPGGEPTTAPVRVAQASDAGRRARRRGYAMVVGGTGVVIAATGLVFGQLARGSWSDAKQLCGDDLVCDDDATLARSNQLAGQARLRADLATGLVIGGAAVVGLGVVLFVTARPAETRVAGSWRVTPTATADTVAITLGRRF